ncbi:MAG: NUDIX hydrolase [Candidatus Izemoplasmatales bacterium]
MEYFDLYDRQGKKLNKLMIRARKNLPGEYHRVVHIWIKNAKDEYLIQQRNKSTDKYPYQWAPTAGAVKSGERPIQAAIRETKEEIGLSLKREEIKFIESIYIDHPDANFIIDLYMVHKEIDLNALTLEKKEVKDVRLATKDDIIKLLKNHQFWNFNDLDPKMDYFNKLEKRFE